MRRKTPTTRPVLIFDLDETLHSSPDLARAYADLAASLAGRRLGLPPSEGRQRLRAEQDRLSAGGGAGFRATVSHSLASLGVSLEEWIEARDTMLDPVPFVRRNEALRQRLRLLARHYELAILTNNSRRHTDVIIEALGIREFFDGRIFTVTESLLLKPDPEVFLRVTRALGVRPEQCISVGDRQSVDLDPAVRLGMRAILVETPEAIYGILDGLLAEIEEARRPAG